MKDIRYYQKKINEIKQKREIEEIGKRKKRELLEKKKEYFNLKYGNPMQKIREFSLNIQKRIPNKSKLKDFDKRLKQLSKY